MTSNLEAYVSRELTNRFKDYTLVSANERLPGNIEADFHFKDASGKDIFAEVKSRKIDRSSLSEILNFYSSISNIYPTLKNFELIVIGTDVDKRVRRELEKLPIRLMTLKDLGITQEKLRSIKDSQTQLRIRKLSPDEATLVTNWEAEKRTIIRSADVQNTLDCTLQYAYVLLHSLAKKGWLERIGRGNYQFIPPEYGLYPNKVAPANAFAIGAAFVTPYYFSYYTSNSHYSFTTQMPFTYFIATTRRKKELEWQSANFKFVTLSKRKFFGYKTSRILGADVCIAEPEKSIVDSFDKPHYAGGIEQLARIVWRGFPQINRELMVDYAVRMESSALIQRLGFITDFLEEDGLVESFPENLRVVLMRHVGKAVVYLDRRRPKTGVFSKNWKIMNNVPKEQLLSEIEIR